MKHALPVILTIMALIYASAFASYAQSVTYSYDDLNRLTRIDYGNGTVIDYTYDDVGNRITENIHELILPTTTASPAGGAYSGAQSVTLTCSDSGGPGCDKIYYTTDGTTPTTSSPIYSSPINISATTTLKFFAKDLGGHSEAVKSQTYTIIILPTTIASPAGGAYNTAKSVTLTCSDPGGPGCDKIYYTTDGTTPTTSSPIYSSPINISATTTLKFFAKDLGGNSESVKSQTYTIDTTPPTGTITINSGGGSTNSPERYPDLLLHGCCGLF